MPKSILFVALCTTIALSTIAYADDFTITLDTDVTNGGFVVDGDDTITLLPGISIDTTANGESGISGTGNNNNVIADGNISTTGDDALAIELDGSGSVQSSGNISTQGTNAAGIEIVATTGAVTVNNTGSSITTSGAGSFAIRARASNENASVLNAADIDTQGTGSYGIYSFAASTGNSTVNNTGTSITTTGDNAYAIWSATDAGNSLVTNSADIDTMGSTAYGIRASVSTGDSEVVNTGSISTIGSTSYGIQNGVATGNSTTTNTGDINTQGLASYGIWTNTGTGNAFISNTGDINTQGVVSYGIWSSIGTGNTFISNAGDISTQGVNALGILGSVGTGDATIINTGTKIATQSNGGYGIQGSAGVGNVLIQNSAIIDTLGNGSFGIRASVGTGDAFISNTGDISTAGGFSEGIYSHISGNGNVSIAHNGNITSTLSEGISVELNGTGSTTITHSGGTISGTTGIFVGNRTAVAPATLNLFGTVTGTGGTAINFAGNGNDVVNLHAGAVINGAMDFGNGNDGMGGLNTDDIDTLNAGPGFNGVITFDDAGGVGQGNTPFESAPENINGKLVLTNGGIQAVFADITSGLAANAVLLDDLVGTIFGDIDSQNAGVVETQGPTGDEQPLGYAPLKKPANMARFDVFDEIKPSYRVWGTSFGALTGQKGTATTLNSDIGFAGAMVGVETAVKADFVAGIFLGRSMSRIDVAFNSMDMETGSTFAGVYTKHNWDETWLNFTLLGGWSNHDDVRYVGATQARADYNSFFVAPAVTLGTRLSGILPDHDVLPSLRVNYTGQFIEGYTETGVALPLSVNSRNVHLLSSRAQIAVPHSWTNSDGTALKIEGVVGIDGTLNLGDDIVQTTIAGSPLDFSTKFANASASGYVGASFNLLSADNRYAFSTSAEGHLDIDGSLALRGNVSVSGQF